jgi:predicted nucleotidyltransferase
MRELVRAAGTGSGAVQRELTQLVAAGLVERERIGSQVHYRADERSPIYQELRGLVTKTVGISAAVRAVLEPFARDGRLELAWIVGTVASGSPTPASDVDLLVVGDATLDELIAALALAQERIGRRVTPTVYSRSDFAEGLKAGSHLVAPVLSGPRIVLFENSSVAYSVGE